MFKQFKAFASFLLFSVLALQNSAANAGVGCDGGSLLAEWMSVQSPYGDSIPSSGLAQFVRFSVLPPPSGSFFMASTGLPAIALTCDSNNGVYRSYTQNEHYVVKVDPGSGLLQVDRLIGGQYWGRSYYAQQPIASLLLGQELVAANVVIRGVYYSSYSSPASNIAAFVTTNASYIPTTLATLQALQASIGQGTTAGLRRFTIQTFAMK